MHFCLFIIRILIIFNYFISKKNKIFIITKKIFIFMDFDYIDKKIFLRQIEIIKAPLNNIIFKD